MTDIENLAASGCRYLQQDNENSAWNCFMQMYYKIVENPFDLNHVTDFKSVGIALNTLMLFGTIKDVDIQQRIYSIAYLCISKAIQQCPDVNAYSTRVMILHYGMDSFMFTVDEVLHILSQPTWMTESLLKKELCKMLLADFYNSPRLETFDTMFSQIKTQLENSAKMGLLGNMDLKEIFKIGNENHQNVFNYLENKILVHGDVDFAG